MSGGRFETELQKRIAEEIERVRDVVGAGTPKDYAEYRWNVGKLLALKQVSEQFIDQVNSIINEG